MGTTQLCEYRQLRLRNLRCITAIASRIRSDGCTRNRMSAEMRAPFLCADKHQEGAWYFQLLVLNTGKGISSALPGRKSTLRVLAGSEPHTWLQWPLALDGNCSSRVSHSSRRMFSDAFDTLPYVEVDHSAAGRPEQKKDVQRVLGRSLERLLVFFHVHNKPE